MRDRYKGFRGFVRRFKFGWQYASAGRYVVLKARQTNSHVAIVQWLEMRSAQLRGESAIVVFPNGKIYTEKAHQNEIDKLRKELTK